MTPTPQERGYPTYQRDKDLKLAPYILSQTIADLKDGLNDFGDWSKKEFSPNEIGVAGLVVEPLREVVKGKVGHCIHLVVKGADLGIFSPENPGALYITVGTLYEPGSDLINFPDGGGRVDWGGQVGSRDYRKVDPSFLKEITSSKFYDLLEKDFVWHQGYFFQFPETLRLADLSSEITTLCGDDNEAILDISNGIKAAHST